MTSCRKRKHHSEVYPLYGEFTLGKKRTSGRLSTGRLGTLKTVSSVPTPLQSPTQNNKGPWIQALVHRSLPVALASVTQTLPRSNPDLASQYSCICFCNADSDQSPGDSGTGRLCLRREASETHWLGDPQSLKNNKPICWKGAGPAQAEMGVLVTACLTVGSLSTPGSQQPSGGGRGEKELYFRG